MAKKHPLVTSTRNIQAAGRGPVVLRSVEAGRVEIGVDYDKADVPERSYYADYCDVQKDRTGFVLLFGKLLPVTSKLRTMIEVTFPREIFFKQLWGTSRDFHETARKVTEQVGIAPLGHVEPTDKVQTFRSNNVFMGMWGEESVMDFYYISPRDFYNWRRTGAEVGLEPVVRVVLPTAVMFEFLEKCKTYIDQEAELEPEVK